MATIVKVTCHDLATPNPSQDAIYVIVINSYHDRKRHLQCFASKRRVRGTGAVLC